MSLIDVSVNLCFGVPINLSKYIELTGLNSDRNDPELADLSDEEYNTRVYYNSIYCKSLKIPGLEAGTGLRIYNLYDEASEGEAQGCCGGGECGACGDQVVSEMGQTVQDQVVAEPPPQVDTSDFEVVKPQEVEVDQGTKNPDSEKSVHGPLPIPEFSGSSDSESDSDSDSESESEYEPEEECVEEYILGYMIEHNPTLTSLTKYSETLSNELNLLKQTVPEANQGLLLSQEPTVRYITTFIYDDEGAEGSDEDDGEDSDDDDSSVENSEDDDADIAEEQQHWCNWLRK